MTNINLSITTPILPYAAYAELTGETYKDIVNAVAAGKLPIYTPPHPPEQNTARVKKYINILAITVEAAKAAGMQINVSN